MSAYTADTDRCDCNIIHEEVVNDVREHMPDEELLFDIADLFKMIGNDKILYFTSIKTSQTSKTC